MGLKEGNEFTSDIRVIFCSLVGFSVLFMVTGLIQLLFSNPFICIGLAVLQILMCIIVNLLFGRLGFTLATIINVLQIFIFGYDYVTTDKSTSISIVLFAVAAILINTTILIFLGTVYSRMFRVKKLYNQARSQLMFTKNEMPVEPPKTETVDRTIIKTDRKAMGSVDPLTTLPNRFKILEEVETWIDDKISLMQSEGGVNTAFDKTVNVIYIKLWNYSEILYHLGHHPTDLLVQHLAHRLREDAHPHDLLGRVATGEFIVACKRDMSKDALDSYARALLESVRSSFMSKGLSIPIEVYAGCASFPSDARFSGDLLSCAEHAMIECASNTEEKLAITHYSDLKDPEFTAQTSRINEDIQKRMEELLPSAIRNEEVYVVYQPQFNIEGELCGFEAFLRWESKELGTLNALDFLQVAEKTGTIYDLGRFSLMNAIEALSVINSIDPALKMTINISSTELKYGDTPGTLADLIAKYKVEPSSLIIDIPEECLTSSFDAVRPAINFIASLGVLMTLDNFGRGYSSINNIPLLPIRGIKLDNYFTRNISEDNVYMSVLISSIIELMHEIDIYVCATGVGSKLLFDTLRKYGCDFYQGGFLSTPIKSKELASFIKKSKAPSKAWTQEAP